MLSMLRKATGTMATTSASIVRAWRLVHRFEQPVESKTHEYLADLADESGGDAEAVEPRVCQDPGGRRSGVPLHIQPCVHEQHAEHAGDAVRIAYHMPAILASRRGDIVRA